MKSYTAFVLAFVTISAVLALAYADYHHKPLEIKHVWHQGYGHHGYGHDGGHGYGHDKHGYDHGKTHVGYSSRYQTMKHGMCCFVKSVNRINRFY